MNAASIKKPASEADFNHEIANNSSYSNNLAQLYRRVNALCRKWNMSREEFENAASMYALMFRDSAPRETQFLYTGRPSLYSNKAKTLAIAFYLTFIEANERLAALGASDDLDASECWQVAIKLAGGRV